MNNFQLINFCYNKCSSEKDTELTILPSQYIGDSDNDNEGDADNTPLSSGELVMTWCGVVGGQLQPVVKDVGLWVVEKRGRISFSGRCPPEARGVYCILYMILAASPLSRFQNLLSP